MARPTAVDALWDLLSHEFIRQRWRVRHYHRAAKRDKLILVEFDAEKRIVRLYPHPPSYDKAMTGLHEMIHIRFGLTGEDWDERQAKWWEAYLWKRLRSSERAWLRATFHERRSSSRE